LIKLAGDRVLKSDVDLYKRHFPSTCIFHVGYGATEMNIMRMYFMNKETPLKGSTVPVGYEVEDTKVLLLDESGRESQAGEVGEIAIQCRFLAVGYWRRPKLTQEAFLPDPMGGEERVYLTGDLGRMREDGCLEHLGRKDLQVKIRGMRVELGEVEGALGSHREIQAVVVTAQGEGDHRRLVAYVVFAKRPGPTWVELRHYLKPRLPDYMIPSVYVDLEALPLTPSGKVDRRALPTPARASQPMEELVAPRTPLEEALASIWAEVLKIPQISVNEDFFELGGNSLLAMQVISRIESDFAMELSPRDITEAPTITQLANLILGQFSKMISLGELHYYLDRPEGIYKKVPKGV
jgi:acyl-coenzyme A synthetase/AMP-(fatty) acid ligase/acyl carrier protein